jgi:hypothetical protein
MWSSSGNKVLRVGNKVIRLDAVAFIEEIYETADKPYHLVVHFLGGGSTEIVSDLDKIWSSIRG